MKIKIEDEDEDRRYENVESVGFEFPQLREDGKAHFHRRGGTRPRTRRVLGRVVQILGRDPEV